MRQIKFRGKRVDTGEWVYGYLVLSSNKKRAFIFIYSDSAEFLRYEVIPETIGQLKCLNKAGKEIYEGDLVKDYDKSIIPIVWNSYSLVAQGKDSFTHYDQDWEVCGNIHDNPELLQERERRVKG